jgi:hypothetical protein
LSTVIAGGAEYVFLATEGEVEALGDEVNFEDGVGDAGDGDAVSFCPQATTTIESMKTNINIDNDFFCINSFPQNEHLI